MDHLEIEYKLLLDKKMYKKILKTYKGIMYTQINYYFTSVELNEKKFALRVRFKNYHYEMTLKTPAKIGRHEYNCNISLKQFENLKQGIFPDNHITQILIENKIDISHITYLTSLKTQRYDIPFTYGLLSLDKNIYNHHLDYELEFEVNHMEYGYKQFQKLIKKYHLSYENDCPSKLKRVLDSL